MADNKGQIQHLDRLPNEKDVDSIGSDGLSATFSKDTGAPMGSIDAEVQAFTAADWKEVVISEAENKRLYWMIVKRVLVIMLGTYFLQSLDKGTMSFAAIMNIREDNGLVGQQYSWLTTILYLGVLVMEYPVSLLIQRFPVGRYLAFSVIGWGATLAVTAACTNWAGLMVCRFLLGAFECCVQPCLLMITGMWFKREEQAQTISLWYAMTGIQQAVGGLMAFGVAHIMSGPLKSWQVLFIALGGITILWGLYMLWWLPDSPMRATCFSEEDRKLLVERVRGNMTSLQNRVWKREQVVEALKDPQVWALCFMQILNTTPTGGYGAFGNIIIRAFGFSVIQTSLLSIAQGAIHIIIVISCAWAAQRFKQTIGVMLACIIPMVAATVVLMTILTTPSNRAGLLVAFYTGFFFNGQAVLIFSLISRNIGGQTKRTFVVACTFVAWCVGNMIGPQVFQANDAPRYQKGFSVHLGFYGAQVFTLLGLRWYLVRQNNRKAERRIAKFGLEAEKTENLDEAFNDLTDQENDHFRYVI